MKQTTIKSLESILSKLIHLNSKIEGNQLQSAIREIAYVRDMIIRNELEVKKH